MQFAKLRLRGDMVEELSELVGALLATAKNLPPGRQFSGPIIGCTHIQLLGLHHIEPRLRGGAWHRHGGQLRGMLREVE